MSQLDNYVDALETHCGALRPYLGAPGAEFGALGTRLRQPGPPS